MIKDTKTKREHRIVRSWASKNREEIFEKFNHTCAECGSIEDLSIHHTKYEIGIENVQVLCNKHHREYHDLEMKKKMMIYFLGYFKREEINDNITVREFKKILFDDIQNNPIEIVSGLKIDGVSDYLLQ